MNKFIPLFSSPIYHSKIENHQSYKRLVLPKLIKSFRNNDSHKASWAVYCNTWQEDVYENSKSYVIPQIERECKKVLDYYNFDPFDYELETWFNVHAPGMYQEAHTHVPNILSGIYYINFDKDLDYPAIFVRDNNTYGFVCSAQGITINNGIWDQNSQFILDIEEGDLIIFPSTLQHLVPKSPNRVDGYRVSLSFNVRKMN